RSITSRFHTPPWTLNTWLRQLSRPPRLMSASCDAVRANVRQTRTIASGIFGIRTGIMRDAIQIAATLLAFVVTVFASQKAGKELDKAAHPDDCLAEPNSSASQGSQWRYRLERGTHRKCWYLRDSGNAPQKAAPSEKTDVVTALPTTSVQAPPTRSDV